MKGTSFVSLKVTKHRQKIAHSLLVLILRTPDTEIPNCNNRRNLQKKHRNTLGKKRSKETKKTYKEKTHKENNSRKPKISETQRGNGAMKQRKARSLLKSPQIKTTLKNYNDVVIFFYFLKPSPWRSATN